MTDQLEWFKSSYSGGSGQECVEAAFLPTGGIAVRDSKNPEGPKLAFAPEAWRALLNKIDNGPLVG